ncbi:GNAT family N-acetyltransferase [Actinoplanes solisilvae]|uniref:GNAT family N-acetyltransferase n=1 Tax=Actinoplanes solisilvae TaxID=2486853 RepID=UPI000FDB0656|nr:GNAT family N-acetyltransferase [Actinoplanes solisilvae]
MTDRLELRPLDEAALRAVAEDERDGQRWSAGFPRDDDRDAARMALRHYDPVFGCYAIVERSTGLAVGTIGFFGAPDTAGTAMIGYGLVPSARGAGYATEALRAIAAFAFARDDVHRLDADPDRDNVASHRVLEKSGFARTRTTAGAYWYTAERQR